MNKAYDVVIAGDVFCDLVFTGLPRMPILGEEIYATDFDMTAGGPFITAVTLRRLGMHVALFCHLGIDFFSRFVLERMEEEDLDTSFVQRYDYPLRTVTAAMSFREDRSFITFTDPRPTEPTPAQALADVSFRHLHVHFLGQLWEQPGLLELARAKGASVSLDSQCCPEFMDLHDVPDKLASVDYFVPNEVEALQITGATTPERALEKLAAWTSTPIIKLGGKGAIASHEGRQYDVPALPVEVVDTTGAGDAFAGGLIYGVLSGLSFEDTLRAASICGGLSTTARGGATRVPRLEELQARLGEANYEL